MRGRRVQWRVNDVAFLSMILGTSTVAGVLGAILGLGGGILLVPLLTLFFGVSLPYAMGASVLSVIATSCGAAAGHLSSGLANIRLGLFLALFTVTGALAGASLVGVMPARAMDTVMRLPMKVSTATSNFMIGLTAAASAGVYFGRGDIHPVIATPVALGVLVGSFIGTRVIGRLSNTTVRKLFLPIVLYLALSMLLHGLA